VKNITVITCCNAASQFLPPVIIVKDVDKNQEFSDGLPQGSIVYMKRKSSYFGTDLIKCSQSTSSNAKL
jgi:hypothetical protein